MNNRFTFFDVLFLFCAAACAVVLGLKEIENLTGTLCFIGLVFVLYFLARRDVRTGEIPYSFWLPVIPFAGIGLYLGITGGNIVCAVLSVVIACAVLVLGWFQLLNGADSFGIAAVLLTLCPFTFLKIVPVSFIAVVVSFMVSLCMYAMVKGWRGHGSRYLAPLCLSVLVVGAIFV